jgi:hypothetical protein
MLDDAEALSKLEEFMDAFNKGDMARKASYFAEEVNVMMNDMEVASTREAFFQLAVKLRERGFILEFVSAASARDDVVCCHYINRYRDGVSSEGGVLLLFDDSGKVARQRALTTASSEPGEFQMPS